MKRYLITTADERTWRFDQPVIFLGEWCKLYDRKHIWSQMDFIVARPFSIETSQKNKNLDYLHDLKQTLLLELTLKLNEFHGVNHSERYWNIVLGNWLQRYVEVVFNRYYTIDQVFRENEISGTTIFETKKYQHSTEVSLDFIFASENVFWNHCLFSKILEVISCTETDKEFIRVDEVDFYQNEIAPPHRSFVKKVIIKILDKMLTLLSRNSDAVITSSYLSKKEELKLQISLWQMPQLFRSPDVDKATFNLESRKKFNLNLKGYSGFEKFVRQEVSSFIPICYFEGYKKLVSQASQLNWPSKPKFIFTSNRFDTDEIFKIWTAGKVEEGVAYFTGQHGNNYGTKKGYSERSEVSSAERFITWGWTNNNSRNVPAYNFKLAGHRGIRFDPCGGVLLIELASPYGVTFWDEYYEFGIYHNEQFDFVKSLPSNIRSNLLIRLHGDFKIHKWFEELRWFDNYPDVKLEKNTLALKELIAKSRLVVHSYDSTGILETLALNIPTVCFWQNGFDDLVPEAIPYYQILKDAKIIFDSPVEIANFIAANWNNIALWWESEKVQNARKVFCEQYSRIEENPIVKLKDILCDCEKNRL